jgi:predicted  nucleic acid-binding Zn-ribbon protein
MTDNTNDSTTSPSVSDRSWDEIINRMQRLEETQDKRLLKLEGGQEASNVTIVRLEVMVDNFSHLVERFENILLDTNKTLKDLNLTIVTINGETKGNAEKIKDLEEDVTSVKKDIKAIDEKGKVDFLQIISANSGKFIFGGGLIGAVAFWIDHLIDTYLKTK